MKVSAKKINKINADIYFANKVFFYFFIWQTNNWRAPFNNISLNDLKAL